MILDFEDKITKRLFRLEGVEEERIGSHLLSVSQKIAARKRNTALENRDKEKAMADIAKNVFESLIYELRAWLSEEENHVYVTSEERQSLLEQLAQSEEWLYSEGTSVHY